jgi:hypothetical protein
MSSRRSLEELEARVSMVSEHPWSPTSQSLESIRETVRERGQVRDSFGVIDDVELEPIARGHELP